MCKAEKRSSEISFVCMFILLMEWFSASENLSIRERVACVDELWLASMSILYRGKH